MAMTVSVVLPPLLMDVEDGCVVITGFGATLMVMAFDTHSPEKPAYRYAMIVTFLSPTCVVVPVKVAVAPLDFVSVRPVGSVPQ